MIFNVEEFVLKLKIILKIQNLKCFKYLNIIITLFRVANSNNIISL